MHAAITSPFKFLIGSTHSAPDMSVNTLVDRFTTLEVKDRDEESARRTVRRLEAALRRAEMAREEAETEATSLRDDLREQRDMVEERLREKTELRQRLDEYEVCISLLVCIHYTEQHD
jgi:chromosome segregation ATPase